MLPRHASDPWVLHLCNLEIIFQNLLDWDDCGWDQAPRDAANVGRVGRSFDCLSCWRPTYCKTSSDNESSSLLWRPSCKDCDRDSVWQMTSHLSILAILFLSRERTSMLLLLKAPRGRDSILVRVILRAVSSGRISSLGTEEISSPAHTWNWLLCNISLQILAFISTNLHLTRRSTE